MKGYFDKKKCIVEQVKRSVPADRLLVHSAKEVESRLRIARSEKCAIQGLGSTVRVPWTPITRLPISKVTKSMSFFSDVENKAPILRVNDAASIASMVCFLIKKILDNLMWKPQPFSCFPWALHLQGKQPVVGKLHPFLLPSHSCCFCCWMLL